MPAHALRRCNSVRRVEAFTASEPRGTPVEGATPQSIEAISVSKSFGTGAVRALDDVSLSIGASEFFTLLGPLGCGKTTLLRLIAGFEEPTSGDIRLFGRSLRGLPPYRRRINTVFQHYALFPDITVAANAGFGLEMLGVEGLSCIASTCPARSVLNCLGERLTIASSASGAFRSKP